MIEAIQGSAKTVLLVNQDTRAEFENIDCITVNNTFVVTSVDF